MKQAPQICIVGLKCFDQIAASATPRYIGGIETQLVLLAKGLAREGCDVTLLTYDHGQRDGEVFDGVTVRKTYNPDVGIAGVRTILRAVQLWAAMKRSAADIFLQMGASVDTGLVALGRTWSKFQPNRFIFCMASDSNYGTRLRAGLLGWEGRAYRYGLRNADLVVAQTTRQKEGLRRATGIASQIIPMSAADPVQDDGNSGTKRNEAPNIVWVGRVTREKRLEWFLEVARRCPALTFQIAGTPNRDSSYSTDLFEEAARLRNIDLLGRLNAAEMHHVYQSAHILCNTSVYEGFPTTFLEAWSYGVPVVTTFDPDDLVTRLRLGHVSSTVEGLVAGIYELRGNTELYREISDSARRYYEATHSVNVVARKFCSVFAHLPARG